MNTSTARRPTDREAQVQLTTREASDLIAFDDAHFLADFIDLCRRTATWLPARHNVLFSMKADNASCGSFQSQFWSDVAPARPEIMAEWAAWPAVYASLAVRNPRLD